MTRPNHSSGESAHSSVPDKAMTYVKRVRQEVEATKAALISETRDGADPTKNALLQERVVRAERELGQAEAKVHKVREKLRQAQMVVLPRVQDSPNVVQQAKRALQVIQADGRVATALQPPAQVSSPLKRMRSSPGAAPGAPLYSEDMEVLVRKAASVTKLKVKKFGEDAVHVICDGVFTAGVWFEVSNGADVGARNYFIESVPKTNPFKSKKVLEPSAVSVFAVDEEVKRFSLSKHAVFNVLTERGCAAIAHYWTHELNGAMAFQALIEWLALHRTMFRDKSAQDDRRLAYDFARGLYLPPCIRPFDKILPTGPPEQPPTPSRSLASLMATALRERPPRHPRTCIPKARPASDRASRHSSGEADLQRGVARKPEPSVQIKGQPALSQMSARSSLGGDLKRRKSHQQMLQAQQDARRRAAAGNGAVQNVTFDRKNLKTEPRDHQGR